MPSVSRDDVEQAFDNAREITRSNSVESRIRWSEGATIIPTSLGTIPADSSPTRDLIRSEITAFAYAMHGAVLRIQGSQRMFEEGSEVR